MGIQTPPRLFSAVAMATLVKVRMAGAVHSTGRTEIPATGVTVAPGTTLDVVVRIVRR
jgi:hypothetical protein